MKTMGLVITFLLMISSFGKGTNWINLVPDQIDKLLPISITVKVPDGGTKPPLGGTTTGVPGDSGDTTSPAPGTIQANTTDELEKLEFKPTYLAPTPMCKRSFGTVTLKTNTLVRFRSPEYPLYIPENTFCGWYFVSPEGTNLRMFCPEISLGANDFTFVRDIDGGNKAFGVTNFEASAVVHLFGGNRALVGVYGGAGRDGRGISCKMTVGVPVEEGSNPPTLTITTPPTTSSTHLSSTITTTESTTTVETTTAVTSLIEASDDCKCGQSEYSRIVGGSETEVNEYPWMAALAYKESSDVLRVFCGGTLISDSFVLTAAHCLDAIIKFKLDSVSVILGLHNIRELDGDTVSIVEPLEYIIHSEYNNDTLDTDIGLIRISPLQFSRLPESIRPVCLPTSKSDQYGGVTGTVAGWGTLSSGGSTPFALMDASLPILHQKNCIDLLGSAVTPNMLCAGFPEGGIDSCQGDSGGPLKVLTPSGRFKLVGIVSWGFGCADPNKPGVYTRVANFLEWTKEKTSGSKTCSPN